MAFAAAFALVFVSGCSRGASDTQETTTGTITRVKPKNDLTKTNNDVLNIGFYAAGNEKNPLLATETAFVNIFGLSHDSLFVLSSNGQLDNSLAESYKVLDNGRFEFTLRAGVTFHDGSALKPSDVVSTINTIKAGSGNTAQARDTIYANVKTLIKSAEASGDNKVVMEFNDGGISPLYDLTFPIVNSSGSGTGLYKIDNFGQNEISFSYYENSWKQAPAIRNIKAIKYTDEDSMAKAYKENVIDAVFTDHRNVGMYKYNKNTRTMNVRTNDFYYLMPNLSSGVMSNLKIRQALSYGIDKESIVSRTFDSNAIVADFPIPSDFFIFDNELLTYTLDVGKCIRRFTELGYNQEEDGADRYLVRGGQRLTIKVIGLKEENIYHKIIAQTLSSQMLEIGVTVNVELLSQEDYAKAVKGKNYDIAIANTTISGNFDLRYLLATGGRCNYNGINISDVDTALNNIATQKTEMDKVKDEYVKIQEMMVKQIPLIGLCFTTDTFVYSDRLSNVSGAYSNYNMLENIHMWSFEGGGTSQSQTVVD